MADPGGRSRLDCNPWPSLSFQPVSSLLQPDAGTVLVFGGFVFVLYREGLSGNVLLLGVSALVLSVLTILFGASGVGIRSWA